MNRMTLVSALGQNRRSRPLQSVSALHPRADASRSIPLGSDGPLAVIRMGVWRLLITLVSQSLPPTTEGSDTFEPDIAEHRKNEKSRDEFAGITCKFVDEHKESEIDRKPSVMCHAAFSEMVNALWLPDDGASISRAEILDRPLRVNRVGLALRR